MAKDLYGIGEMLLIHTLPVRMHFNLTSCEVMGKLATYGTDDGGVKGELTGYSVMTEDGKLRIIPECHLMRKPPLRAGVVDKFTWDFCKKQGMWCPNPEGIRIAEEMIRTGPWKLF